MLRTRKSRSMSDFGVDRRVYLPSRSASTRVYLKYQTHGVVDRNRLHRFRGAERLDDAIELAVGTVASWIGRAVETDNRRAERGGEMERPGVGADDEPGAAEQKGQLAKVRCRRNLGAHLVGKVFFARAPCNERVISKPLRKRGKTLDRPLLLRTPSARQQDDSIFKSGQFAGGGALSEEISEPRPRESPRFASIPRFEPPKSA